MVCLMSFGTMFRRIKSMKFLLNEDPRPNISDLWKTGSSLFLDPFGTDLRSFRAAMCCAKEEWDDRGAMRSLALLLSHAKNRGNCGGSTKIIRMSGFLVHFLRDDRDLNGIYGMIWSKTNFTRTLDSDIGISTNQANERDLIRLHWPMSQWCF